MGSGGRGTPAQRLRPRGVRARGKQLSYGEPKTKIGRRALALDSVTLKALRRHRKRQAAENLTAGQAYEAQSLIFANPLGAPLHSDIVSKWFKRHVADAGLPHLMLHGPRHAYATLALQAGVHPKVISERLGQATVALTVDVYSHVIPAMQEGAAERVAQLIAGINAE